MDREFPLLARKKKTAFRWPTKDHQNSLVKKHLENQRYFFSQIKNQAKKKQPSACQQRQQRDFPRYYTQGNFFLNKERSKNIDTKV